MLFVDLARPCPLDLGGIVPESAPRFHCQHCDREVHVLSNMSEAEARRSLASRERPCVAYLRGPNGQVRFREPLVPVERLARRLLGAGALLVSVAGCAPHEGERVEAVDLGRFAASNDQAPPSFPHPGSLERRWSGGAPVQPEPDRGVFIEPDALNERALANKLPTKRFAATKAARRGKPTTVYLEYCVDRRGRVVDAKHVAGDR